MTSYETIYKRALNKISDVMLLSLEDSDVQEIMHEYLMSAIAKFLTCKSDLSDRDDVSAQFNIDLPDIDIEILAIMIVKEWIEPQLNSTQLTSQFYGTSETKLNVLAWARHSSLYLETI